MANAWRRKKNIASVASSIVIRFDVASARRSYDILSKHRATNGPVLVPVNIWRQFDLRESRLKSPRGVRGRKRLTEASSSLWLFDHSSHHHRAYTSPDSRKIYRKYRYTMRTLIQSSNIVWRFRGYRYISSNKP